MKVTLHLIKYYNMQMCGGVRCGCTASPILRGSDCPVFPANIPRLLILKSSVPVYQKLGSGNVPAFFSSNKSKTFLKVRTKTFYFPIVGGIIYRNGTAFNQSLIENNWRRGGMYVD